MKCLEVNLKMSNKILRIDYKKKINNDLMTKIFHSFQKNGVVIVNNVLTKKKCKDLIKLLDYNYTKYSKYFYNEKKVSKISARFGAKVLDNLHNKNFEFVKLIDKKKILHLVKHFLQKGSYLNKGEIICQDFGARTPTGITKPQQLHNDARIVGTKFPIMVNTMWALDPFTKDNGATRYVIGSHKSLNFPKNGKKYNKEIIIELPIGSVIIFNSQVWHGGSKISKNNIRRWSIIIRYSRWFYKTSFDFYKNTTSKIFSLMNNTQKDLLGFRFVPPIDEFTASSTRQKYHLKPKGYKLP